MYPQKIYTNVHPSNSFDDATWRRMKVIPFTDQNNISSTCVDIETNIFSEEKDIELIMAQSGLSEDICRKAYIDNNKCVVDAIMFLID